MPAGDRDPMIFVEQLRQRVLRPPDFDLDVVLWVEHAATGRVIYKLASFIFRTHEHGPVIFRSTTAEFEFLLNGRIPGHRRPRTYRKEDLRGRSRPEVENPQKFIVSALKDIQVLVLQTD